MSSLRNKGVFYKGSARRIPFAQKLKNGITITKSNGFTPITSSHLFLLFLVDTNTVLLRFKVYFQEPLMLNLESLEAFYSYDDETETILKPF